ncbi:MAG: hypothetical protein Q9181_007026 [Wetmoreana brouardii]
MALGSQLTFLSALSERELRLVMRAFSARVRKILVRPKSFSSGLSHFARKSIHANVALSRLALNSGAPRTFRGMEAYTYEEAIGSEHFRILVLYNARQHEPLRCSLETLAINTEASNENAYEALSYVWGSTEGMQHIICDGRRLPITQDLETALRHFRDESVSRRLWIDQICINQGDLDERSAQIRNMGNIYRSAKRVVVWLGEESESSDRAIKFTQELTEAITAFERSYPGALILRSDFGKPLKPTNYSLPPVDGDEWVELTDFASRKWFTRLWIVQEAALNENVTLQCGGSFLSWMLFEQLSGQIGRHPSLALQVFEERRPGIALASLISFLKDAPDGTWQLEDVVDVLASQQASDPRDYIYAALSHASESDAQLVIPDYKRSTASVYTDFTRLMLELGRKHILKGVEFNVINSAIAVPSWVLDWTTTYSLAVIEGRERMNDQVFTASGSCPESWTFTNNGTILRVKGRQVDRLLTFGDPWPTFAYNGESKDYDVETQRQCAMLQCLRTAWELASSCKSDSDAEPSVASLCLTCCRENCHQEGSDTLEDIFEVFFKFYEGLRMDLDLDAALAVPGTIPGIYSRWLEMRRSVQLWIWAWSSRLSKPQAGIGSLVRRNRTGQLREKIDRLFHKYYIPQLLGNKISKTQNGYLANVPKVCEEGDIVAILYGWNVPFILRPVATGYLLVGDCYVHSIMHGEVIKEDIGVEQDFDIV